MDRVWSDQESQQTRLEAESRRSTRLHQIWSPENRKRFL